MKECPICHTCFSDKQEICSNDKSMLLDLIAGSPIIDDKYRLEKKIGIGRVGMVFQATVLETGQMVAIKVISPNLVVADESLVERFFFLIGAFATLEHVNIVKIFDFGQTEPNILYFVMEYLPIPTLADILQRKKQLPLDLALSIASKVCEAVANANRNGVYHLDLKPSNIFVSNDETPKIVKVVDFAVVRLKVPSLLSGLSPMQRDYLLGKPYYSAPEQFSSEQIDPRSEVYAIGAILYHLLAGSPPFTGGSYPMLKMQHMGVSPTPLREIRPEIPPTVESVIIKALDKRSTQRHSSVIALAVQLSAQLAKYKEFLSQSSHTLPTLPSPPEPFYSSDPTPAPIDYPAKSLPDATLPSLPSLPEPFYSNDPTPPPILEKQSSFPAKMEETLGAFPLSPESAYFSESTPVNSRRTSFSNLSKLEETLGGFPEMVEDFYSSDITPMPQTSPVYSETPKENPETTSKPSGLTAPVYSIASLVAPTLLIEEGNIVTRPLASESFHIGERFDEVSQNSVEQAKVFEQDDNIDQVFELAGIGESAEKLSISTFLTLSSSEKTSLKENYWLSPSAIIYLFVELFVPALLSGQRSRQMHSSFNTERERLAALLLVSALFSLSCRGVLEISVGSGGTQKKQIALSQKNEGFIVRGIDLESPTLDILESKIVDCLKQNKITRFYNIFLHLAQTSVATSEREAICEIVADMIAEELKENRFLRSKQRNRKLESGESAIQYELDTDLTPYKGQATAVQNWLQGLQQEASIELSGKPVQPFIHILKYYTDLFRHNSKELSKS